MTWFNYIIDTSWNKHQGTIHKIYKWIHFKVTNTSTHSAYRNATILYFSLYDWIILLLKCYALGKDDTVCREISILQFYFDISYQAIYKCCKIILWNYLSYSKYCWVFHPMDLEGFPRENNVSYGLNNMCAWIFYEIYMH